MIPVWLFIIVVLMLSVGSVIGGICAYQLYRWEQLLKRSRVQVRYKGKPKMTPRLLDWLVWAQRLDSDKAVSGQVIYSQGGTVIALMRPLPKDHNKTTTKEKKAA